MEKEVISFEDCWKRTPARIEKEMSMERERLIGELKNKLGKEAVGIFTAVEAGQRTKLYAESMEADRMPDYIGEHAKDINELHRAIYNVAELGLSELALPIKNDGEYSVYEDAEMKEYFETLGYKYDIEKPCSSNNRYMKVNISWCETEE